MDFVDSFLGMIIFHQVLAKNILTKEAEKLKSSSTRTAHLTYVFRQLCAASTNSIVLKHTFYLSLTNSCWDTIVLAINIGQNCCATFTAGTQVKHYHKALLTTTTSLNTIVRRAKNISWNKSVKFCWSHKRHEALPAEHLSSFISHIEN